MSSPTGEIGFLKQQILSVISDNIDTIQDIADYEKVGFKGFPAVTVTCSGNENVFWSSAENERTFLFDIRVYVQIENKPILETLADNQKKLAEEIMERTVDQIINAFDTTESFTLDDSADNGVEAVPSTWGYAQLPSGWCRFALISLKLKRVKLV